MVSKPGGKPHSDKLQKKHFQFLIIKATMQCGEGKERYEISATSKKIVRLSEVIIMWQVSVPNLREFSHVSDKKSVLVGANYAEYLEIIEVLHCSFNIN